MEKEGNDPTTPQNQPEEKITEEINTDTVTQERMESGIATSSHSSSEDDVMQIPIHTVDDQKTDPKPAIVENEINIPIPTLNGQKIDPKPAPVDQPQPTNQLQPTNQHKKIFVGGVSQETKEEHLMNFFGRFGQVNECVMLKDQLTKNNRGFAFITFDREEVAAIVCEIHYHIVNGKRVECKKAQAKGVADSSNPNTGMRPMMRGPGMRVHHVAGPSAYGHAYAHAAAAHARSAVMAGYQEIYTAYPPLPRHGYYPYVIPSIAANARAPHPIPFANIAANVRAPPPVLANIAASANAPPPVAYANLGYSSYGIPTMQFNTAHPPPTQFCTQAAPSPPVPQNPYEGYNLTSNDLSAMLRQ